MNEFKTILTKLKEIISNNTQSNKKILDKDIATVLNIKPTALASFKRRDKPPYKAILTYCHDNRLDVRKVLFNDLEPIVEYPIPLPVEDGKIQIRYFRTLEVYAKYFETKVALIS